MSKVTNILLTKSFPNQKQKPSLQYTDAKVLVIGAGGLGCELLKTLALSGFKNIHVIDLDTIEVSNLNRQFLFRISDVGLPKAEAAAKFIQSRCPSVSVTPHFKKIQELDDDFYCSFDIVIAGLDSLEARLWMNSKLQDLAKVRKKIIPYIDGGSLEWTGNLRFIIPSKSACMKCIQDQMSEMKNKFPMCTLSARPRIPAHLVHWAMEVPFKEKYKVLDGDNPEHIAFITEKANEHADRFSLAHVDERFTRTVVKGTVPAIASTQAQVASSCVIEAVKLLTQAAENVSFHILINGQKRIFFGASPQEKNPKCEDCNKTYNFLKNVENETVDQFRERVASVYGQGYRELSLTINHQKVYWKIIKSTHANLGKKLSEFVKTPYDQFFITAQKMEPLILLLE